MGRGASGFILDVYDDGYDVEFSRVDGTPASWFFLEPADIEPTPEVMASSDRSMI